ncbi:MAG: hypothetical protein K9N47_17855 [Prosthecobacter sp.]|uniref:hypothetical protein n=1 Tax=Prosthecobacter sp. TaxID=1965333 RepID=UPI0025D3B2C2|nr:hypothetical protein [Prosthecobacter sp.]MCF7787991.1 hypothetical protein [Prosthecobacter sp.]
MNNRSGFKSAIHFSLIAVIACVSSCRSTKPPPLSEWQQESLRMTKEGERQAGLDNEYRANYAAKYAAYRCEIPGLPVIKSYKLPFDEHHGVDTSKWHPTELAPGIAIRTQLGKGILVKNRGGPLRTNTRHILEVSGKEMGRAESLLTWEGGGEVMGSSTIQFTEATHEVLIEDFIGGAGARYRHIAFIPEVGSAPGKDALPSKWRTVYVDLPSHVLVGSELGEIGTVHGILNGKIYVEMDGCFYAFPVDDFVEEKLEFTVG